MHADSALYAVSDAFRRGMSVGGVVKDIFIDPIGRRCTPCTMGWVDIHPIAGLLREQRCLAPSGSFVTRNRENSAP